MAMTMTLFGCGSDDATKEQISDNSKITETIENTAFKRCWCGWWQRYDFLTGCNPYLAEKFIEEYENNVRERPDGIM